MQDKLVGFKNTLENVVLKLVCKKYCAMCSMTIHLPVYCVYEVQLYSVLKQLRNDRLIFQFNNYVKQVDQAVLYSDEIHERIIVMTFLYINYCTVHFSLPMITDSSMS